MVSGEEFMVVIGGGGGGGGEEKVERDGVESKERQKDLKLLSVHGLLLCLSLL